MTDVVTLPDGSTITLDAKLMSVGGRKYPGNVLKPFQHVYDTPSGVATVEIDAVYAAPAPPPPVPSTGRTTWVTPGTPPLSDQAAAALVTHVPETVPSNAAVNALAPSDAQLAAFHQAAASFSPHSAQVTGRPGLTNPSTDDLIQWSTQKWGIPTDWIRAEAMAESSWRAGFVNSSDNGGVSVGLLQIKVEPTTDHPGTTETLALMTAFNLDYQASIVRYYFDGMASWLAAPYAAGNEWGSIGDWYSPSADGSGSTAYVAGVQAILAARSWPHP